MRKNNLKIVKIDKNKSLFNYEKKILINNLTLDLKLGYFEFEKIEPQKVKFTLEIDYKELDGIMWFKQALIIIYILFNGAIRYVLHNICYI